jgi:hypothetical protein
MKSYEEIWPEAYETWQPVRLCGKTDGKKFTTAWLQCRDGRVYNLTREEFAELMPKHLIHSKYRKRRDAK